MTDDATLLRRYAHERSEAAFAELVRRYLPLVYSAAQRRLGNHGHRASDVTQAVFITLARDAASLACHPVLAAWLYAATRNAALDLLRTEKRRAAREREAFLMQENSQPPEAGADWARLRPAIDEAMDRLRERDREAVLLRYFQERPFAEIASLLGLSEEAARKRVDRALEKLRTQLGRTGITSTSAALAILLTRGTTVAAPPGLATSVTGLATAGSIGTAAATFTFMSLPKISAGIAAVLLIGGAIALFDRQRTIDDLRANATQLHDRIAKLETAAAARPVVRAATEPAPARAALAAAPTPTPAAPATVAVASPAPIAVADIALVRHGTPEERARLRQRYDPFLLGKLGLTEEQADRFVTLKLATYEVQDDLNAAMQKTGTPGGTKSIEQMRSQLTKPMWDEIYRILGPQGTREYGAYELASAYRPDLVDLFQRAEVPITDKQADELTRLAIQRMTSYREKPTDLSMRMQTDWNAVARDAADLLTPAQAAVLRTRARPSDPK